MVGARPDYLIIGAQRCGTTSLYNYLTAHPDVLPASQKELHFFSYWSSRGSHWYYAQFPPTVEKYVRGTLRRRNMITGEASPSYLFHPHAPAKVRGMLPDVKLIILLRNPVDRAFSNYKYNVKVAYEDRTMSFERALELEQERVGPEREKIISDPEHYSFAHMMYSYVARGVYIDQLENWAHYFQGDQFMVLKSEDFFSDPMAALKRVARFLGLTEISLRSHPKHNRTANLKMNADTRRNLAEFYRPHNERLYEFLGEDFEWDV